MPTVVLPSSLSIHHHHHHNDRPHCFTNILINVDNDDAHADVSNAMPATDARYSLPALQSLDLPQPVPGQAASHISPVGTQQPRPPTSSQPLPSAHQINSGLPPSYRNGSDFNRLPSLAGVAASLPHTQSAAPISEQQREPAYPPQSSYDPSRILPPPVPRVQGVLTNYGQQQQSTTALPPLSANSVSRDGPKFEDVSRPNPYSIPIALLRSQQSYKTTPSANLNGDAYPLEMTPYSTTTLVHGRTLSQSSSFAPSQRPAPAPSPEGGPFYSPMGSVPVTKNEAWAGEDQYPYLNSTVNGVDVDPSEMDAAAIMQIVVNHCNAIVQFSTQYGSHPRGILQTPSPSPNATFPQGIPEDKLSDMVHRAIAVVRLLRNLSRRQAEQAKTSTKGLLDGMDLDTSTPVDGDNDGLPIRPLKRFKPPSIKDSDEVPKPKYKKRSRAPPPSQCASCGIGETPEWRKGPEGARTLCNACGLHYAKLSRNRDRELDAAGKPIRPPVNIEMLRNSIRATCQPTRTHANTEPPESSSAPKVEPVPHRNASGSTMPMVWEAPVAARPANPYAASATEQANVGQMQTSNYSSSAATAQQSPADSLNSSGYGAPVTQSPVSALHTPSYPTPSSHLPTSTYTTPMTQTTDPLYQLAHVAGNAWNAQPQSVLPQGSVSQAQSTSASTDNQYWQPQPSTSLLANQMSNVRADLPEGHINGWSSMRMQAGGPMSYSQTSAATNHQLQENARVYG